MGFWLALAGGVALARAGQRFGTREGYGASLAAMLETVSIVGPARLSAPVTQALTAPLLGRLEGLGVPGVWQVLACMAIRLAHNALTAAFFIFVIVGGLDAYAGTYDSILGRLPGAPRGPGAALALTLAGLLGWGAFASTVQVALYRRGLRRWPREVEAVVAPKGRERVVDGDHRFDPRAVAVSALLAFAILLATTDWPVLAAVAGWLAATWLLARPDRSVVPAGAFLAALLGLGAFTFTAVAGLGIALALERAARAVLLVATATWLRGATGFAGLREVIGRVLGRLRRVPSMDEARIVLGQLGSGRRLGASARALLGALAGVNKRPMPIVDGVLGWVVREADRFRPFAPAGALALALRPRDLGLLASAAAPSLAFLAT
jgi:hypothetical protein